MVMGKPDIERILAERLRLAQTIFEHAQEAFKQITSDIPSPLPHPDGTQSIKNAGATYRDVMNSYALALREFNEFILHGTIPEDLKEAIRAANHER